MSPAVGTGEALGHIFGLKAIVNFLFASWIPALAVQIQPWLEAKSPRIWLKLLAFSYSLRSST